MPTRHGGSFWKNAKTYRRFNCRRVTTCPCASTPWTWKTDLAMSRPIVVIVCMLGSSKLWEPQPQPHSWHSRAGGGALHSINSRHRVCGWPADELTLIAAGDYLSRFQTASIRAPVVVAGFV